MSLQNQIDSSRAEIKTDNYAMSIGEWLNLYTDNELDIHPEFQRFYRWDENQKSRFIESILLGIPIPPIFVAQRQDGVWDVVDGLQRLSTIFQFVGLLKDKDNEVMEPLRLKKTRYLPDLENKVWEGDLVDSFTPAQRMLIKRTKIGVSIILRESDPRSKFELFQRLNTGGSVLSEQEVRNCILVMSNPGFYDWLRALADDSNFREVIALTDRAISEQYDMEIALRFIVFRSLADQNLQNIGDVGEFLTDKMAVLAEDAGFDKNREGDIFRQTFSFLNQHLGENACKKYSPEKQKFTGGFSVSAFEVVALGVAHWMPQHTAPDLLLDKVKNIWNNPTFIAESGSGISASRRIPKTLQLGRESFRP
ncbi:MAG: DUF262 domain-containing protein [Verrucomicrobiae bacterium]|nr:DUF262 domain-containing protein [Verrucomicrobiae bacterium]